MRYSVIAPDGAPEIAEGDDVAAILVALLRDDGLLDGDVVAVTSKAVAKAEGRVRSGSREEAIAEETARIVARRGPTTIARTRHGLTMAAAGVDASNIAAGQVVLLPLDPDASARRLRRRVSALTGCNVGVLVTDTAGRAWREGQTDIAIGAAGLRVVEDFVGRVDAHGNELVVTAPAVADEMAGAAELAQGKLAGRPFAVLRGRADLVLSADDDGTGASALIRPDAADMFGLGSREAVLRALEAEPAHATAFGRPVDAHEMADAIADSLRASATAVAEDLVVVRAGDPRIAWAAGVAAYACGWEVTSTGAEHVLSLRPVAGLLGRLT